MSAAGSNARRILGMAWPVLVGQWAVMAYGVLDTMMTGHASPADLASMALGASIYASVFVGLLGVINALNPIVAHHYGGQRFDAIGVSFVQGLWLALLLTAVGVVFLAFPDAWLVMSDVAPEVRSRVHAYLYALAFGLPGALLFRTAYAFNTGISRPKVVMAIQVIGLGLKLVLNWVLVFGHLGAPAMGAVGCGIASAIVYWSLTAMALVVLLVDPSYRRFTLRRAWPRWADQRELLRLGVPMGASYLIEVTSFTFMALLIAKLGTVVTGAHQITANLAAFCYMIPLALSVATSTLVAQSLGASDDIGARAIALSGIRIALGTAVLTSALLWLGRETIVALYTDDAAVAAVALSLIVYMIAFHVFDALQGITGFILRAYKISFAPMLIYAFALWGFGLVGGYFVAFYPVLGPPRGAAGMWLMQALALALAAALLLAFYGWLVRRETAGRQVAARAAAG